MHAKPWLILSPYFGPAAIGGAQLSARLAWEGLRSVTAGALFQYGPGLPADTPHSGVLARSQLAAIGYALRYRGAAQHLLIWHIGMLKLLPFVRHRRANVTLMLLGIEAWRRHDPLTRLLLRRVDHFLSISDYTWQRFLNFYPEFASCRHSTVHLGLGEAAEPIQPPVDPPAALIISRLDAREDYKGHRELIGVWQLLRAQIPQAELWIAGDGDLRAVLEQLVQAQGLQQAIRFFGRVSEAQKFDLLSRCHCLAMPSRGEGFGLVYLEAMRLGRPCLVSNADAGREVVNPPEAGLAVDPGDPAALTAALVRLLSRSPQWDRWSAQARTRYEQHFTARQYQQRLVTALGLGDTVTR